MSNKKFNKNNLIAAVRARPALWRIDDRNFKKTEMTSILWKEIGGICKISATDAKTKWKSLKDQFRRELQKFGKSKWQYFRTMHFIKHYMLIGTGEEYLPNDLDNEQDATTTDEVNANNENLLNDDHEYSEVGDENEIFYPPLSSLEFVDTSQHSESSSATGKRKRDDVYDNFIQIEQKRIALLEKSILQSENSDLQFFKSLVPYMEAFSPLEKLQVRTKIQEIVLQRYMQIQGTLVEQLILKEESI